MQTFAGEDSLLQVAQFENPDSHLLSSRYQFTSRGFCNHAPQSLTPGLTQCQISDLHSALPTMVSRGKMSCILWKIWLRGVGKQPCFWIEYWTKFDEGLVQKDRKGRVDMLDGLWGASLDLPASSPCLLLLARSIFPRCKHWNTSRDTGPWQAHWNFLRDLPHQNPALNPPHSIQGGQGGQQQKIMHRVLPRTSCSIFCTKDKSLQHLNLW